MKKLLLLSGLVVLAGCSIIKERAPRPSLYVLHPLPMGAGLSVSTPVPPTAIREPEIAPGLNTEKIAVLKADRSLDFINNVEWPAQLDEVLESFIQESYEDALPLGAVVDKEHQSSADLELTTAVRDFQAEYSGFEANSAPVIRVTFVMTLQDRNERRTLNKFILTRAVPAESNTETAIVAAFEAATRDVVGESIQRFFGGVN